MLNGVVAKSIMNMLAAKIMQSSGIEGNTTGAGAWMHSRRQGRELKQAHVVVVV